jgi:3-hydroxyacyl-CoA dehydrogenase
MIPIATFLLASLLAADPAPKLTDVSWLAGSWRGTMSGSRIEEVWTPAAGPVMMGMFRMVDASGQALFYEFQVIEETASGVRLKIKHFNRALRGQEEREKFADFQLTRVASGEAFFEADEEDARVTLLYQRLPNGRLSINFHKVVKSTGKEQKMQFPFERATEP